VYENRYRVNAALINDITIRGATEISLQAQVLLISKISPIKLIDGGAAILQILNINHHKAIEGMICNKPLQIIMLRDPVRS
jgi:hypothetical protein